MSLLIWLSGPETTRPKVERALEDANLAVFEPTEWPIRRDSYSAEHCQHLPVVPSGPEPNEPYGFVAVLGHDESASMSVAQRAVEPYGWVLRMHHKLPPEPKPDPVTATLQAMQQRIAELESRVGVN